MFWHCQAFFSRAKTSIWRFRPLTLFSLMIYNITMCAVKQVLFQLLEYIFASTIIHFVLIFQFIMCSQLIDIQFLLFCS